MTKIERNKKTMEQFKECINNNDKVLADKLIDSHAEFASLISDEKLSGGASSFLDFYIFKCYTLNIGQTVVA